MLDSRLVLPGAESKTHLKFRFWAILQKKKKKKRCCCLRLTGLMQAEDLDVAPLATCPERSSSATERPRCARENAVLQPMTPPPSTTASKAVLPAMVGSHDWGCYC